MSLADCQALAEWAQSLPITCVSAASPEQIGRHLRYLDATLPTRHIEHETGKARLAVYVSILRDLSDGAMTYMAREACKRLKWFPTPAECLEIAAEHREPESECAETLRICSRRQSEIAEAWIAGPNFDADVPEQWTRIAIERGTLRRLQHGTIVIRSQYHGPFKSA